MTAKTVCVIGYGPSGACAAKYLNAELVQGAGHIAMNQGYHRFKVCIFEAQPRLGGLWPSSPADKDGQMHPEMMCNQSRHTVQFSDLAWDPAVSEFPRAHEVGQYLARYAAAYLPEPAEAEGNTPEALYKRAQGTVEVHTNTRVVAVEPVAGDGIPGDAGWDVRVATSAGAETARRFDAVVVASGFFGRPDTKGLDAADAAVPVIPAGKYRDLTSLLGGKAGPSAGSKILVVGSQMSAYEIAGTIAKDLSSARHSPGYVGIEKPEKYSIYHVSKRPSWIFPLISSVTPKGRHPRFMPIDLPSYNLAQRKTPLSNNQGIFSQEVAQEKNKIFQTLVGSDQGDASPHLRVNEKLTRQAPYIAMSDYYREFVRSGDIVHVPGKLTKLSGRSATIKAVDEELPEEEHILDDIAAVVSATGWAVKGSLDFFPQSIKDMIEFDEDDNTHPVVLKFHGTHRPEVANLGFVGFYRSPYWGVMEMQSRFLAKFLSQDSKATTAVPPLSSSLKSALDADDSMARERALRAHRREHPEAAAQFPMGDYPWLMNEFARALDLTMAPPPIGPEMVPPGSDTAMNILTPSRYPSRGISGQNLDEMSKNLAATRTTAAAALSRGRFVAGAVFTALQGEWAVDREITSFNSHYGFSSGHYVGTARFHPRAATPDALPDASSISHVREYLYKEEGQFTPLGSQQSFSTWRHYIYRYDEVTDALTVWFADNKDHKKVDCFFHTIELDLPPPPTTTEEQDDDAAPHWTAKGAHYCAPDMYELAYRFDFSGVQMPRWTVTTHVKGEKKDYRQVTQFSRNRRTETWRGDEKNHVYD